MTQNNKTPLQEALEGVVWPNIRLYEFHRIQKAAQAYADLPAKIEGMKHKIDIELPDTLNRNIGANQMADNILNIIKEQQK